MPSKFLGLLAAIYFILAPQVTQADMQLNWQIIGKLTKNIAVTYKDKDHIIISDLGNLKLLKLDKHIYLMQSYDGFKLAFNLTKLRALPRQNLLTQQLPTKQAKFLPIMVVKGHKQNVHGYEGDIILLKDRRKSVTIVTSQNEQHIAIKNALLPMLTQLLSNLPNLPNKQLIDILKHQEFGLPLHVENQFTLTQSEMINGNKDAYSLKGYKVIGSLKDMVF